MEVVLAARRQALALRVTNVYVREMAQTANRTAVAPGMPRSSTRALRLGSACLALLLAGAGFVPTSASAATALPDHRAYELVSPPDKNGSDVMARSTRLRAASDGSAVSFASLGAFGDVQGTGVATEYVGQRDGLSRNGWSTHAITPQQDPLTFLAAAHGLDPLYEGEFSPDLTKCIFRAWSPLTNDANVAKVANFYVRTDLRSAGVGSYQLATPCPACGGTPLDNGIDRPSLDGTSADFTHVLFESDRQLTSDAAPEPPLCGFLDCFPQLYETVNGVVRLAGILPDGTPASTSFAGYNTDNGVQGGAFSGLFTRGTISSDGSRVQFTVPASADPSGTTQLYLRDDHGTLSTADDSTVRISASEKTSPDPPQPATYQIASADGARVFFTTSEQLTNDDTNAAADLYMYDTSAPAGEHLTRVSIDRNSADIENSVAGVIGASTDGRYVYFIAAGQLVAGQPTLQAGVGVYLWHDGQGIRFIGQLTGLASDETDNAYQNTWNSTLPESRVTPDGRHLLFVSHSGVGLTGYDHGAVCGNQGQTPCQELYIYSAESGQLSCVSCNPNGDPATADANDVVERSDQSGSGGSGTTFHLNHPLTDDGSHVFFSTAEALVPEDTNGKVDVYQYNSPSPSDPAGSVHLISSGTSPANSYFMDASASGDNVFFLTRDQLVGWDHDQNYDLYDARINGGFPEPATPLPPCSDDGCHGEPMVPLGIFAPGSARFTGAGNSTKVIRGTARKRKPKSIRCKHGLVRKRVHGKTKCVKTRRAKRITTRLASSVRKAK
jgi:hypothetical protein